MVTECPSLTARRARRAERAGVEQDPIVWREAVGANVIDADGNRYVDLTAGFGVAAVGHRHPAVVEALRQQSDTLLHGLGDVHPSEAKLCLLDTLVDLLPFAEPSVMLGLNGSDAVAAALKTAQLVTGRPGLVAFEGGYHGLMYAPLAACGYAEAFRKPFAGQLNPHVRFAPYPHREADLDAALSAVRSLLPGAGAVLVEPALARGGIVFPPDRFLPALAALAAEHGALLIVDEIYTGLGRTGARFASRAVTPDLICLGKALGGGMPLSACAGPRSLMEAWGDPDGEALHTATFAGHPLSCAAATAALRVVVEDDLAARAATVGARFRLQLERALTGKREVRDVRGRGLMLGVSLARPGAALTLVQRLLQAGYITLPAGADADVLALTPPLTIAEHLLEGCSAAIAAAVG